MTATEQLHTVEAAVDQACPTCLGRGEVQVGLPTRDPYTGVWDVDTRICEVCDGTGTIPDQCRVCEACGCVFDQGDQVCDHGHTLCGDDRGECSQCAYVIAEDHAGERYER